MRPLVLALLLVLLAACTGTPTATEEESAALEPVAIPDTPVGEAAGWVLEALNGEDPFAAEEWGTRLHQTFLDEVSAEEVVDLLETRFRPLRLWTPTAYDGTDDHALVTIQSADGERFDMTVVVDDAGLMTGLVFAPARAEHDPAQSIEEVEQRLGEMPGDVRALVTLEQDGRVQTLIDRAAGDVGPLASIAKLFVLIAVVEQVDAGVIGWEDTLQLTDDVRSLPSGRLQDAPEGAEVSVFEAAKAMIEISDNTATDLLIATIGRDAVESAIADLDLLDEAGLRPFPTTREVFALSWGVDEATASAWDGGDEAERRAILDSLTDDDLDVAIQDVTNETSWQRGVNWFASPRDVAAAHDRLAELAERHDEIERILGANPGAGLRFDRDAWPTIAFKGGSSRGVVTGSWRAVGEDGRVLTLVLMLAGDDATHVDLQTDVFFGLAEDLFALSR